MTERIKCKDFASLEARDLQTDMEIITQEGQVQKIVNKENLMDKGKTQITLVPRNQQETGIGKLSSYIVDSNQIFMIVKTEEFIIKTIKTEQKKCCNTLSAAAAAAGSSVLASSSSSSATSSSSKKETFFSFEAQNLQIDMEIITQEGQVQKIVNKENLADKGKTRITVMSRDQQETGIEKLSSYIVDSNQIFTIVKTEEAITTTERKKCNFFFVEAQDLKIHMNITTGGGHVQKVVNVKNFPDKGKTLIAVMSYNQLETDIRKKLSFCIVDLNQIITVVQTVEDIRE